MIRNFKVGQPRMHGNRDSPWSHVVSGKEIQHIVVDRNPIIYIDMSFDMDICKNYFDGKKLCIKSWNKLINRQDYVKPNALLMVNYTNNSNVRELSKKRIEKYRNRGFDIDWHPLYDQIVDEIETIINLNKNWHFDLSVY